EGGVGGEAERDADARPGSLGERAAGGAESRDVVGRPVQDHAPGDAAEAVGAERAVRRIVERHVGVDQMATRQAAKLEGPAAVAAVPAGLLAREQEEPLAGEEEQQASAPRAAVERDEAAHPDARELDPAGPGRARRGG